MGIFNKIFGSKNSQDEESVDYDNQQSLLEEKFDKDWTESVSRFFSITGLEVKDFRLKNPQTNEDMLPHEGLAGTFEDWKQISSLYDRRGLLFNQLYSTFDEAMNTWQTANYYVLDRRSDVALEILETSEMPAVEDESYPHFCDSYARSLINLGMYKESLDWAVKAANKLIENTHTQTLLADAKHLSGKHEEAHNIYNFLMSKNPQNSTEDIQEMFKSLFAKDTGVVPSPILAFEILKDSEKSPQTDLFWHLAEAEFYDSAYFRMQHSYYLAKMDRMNQSFAKLYTLVREMPWLKEATLNLEMYFRKIDPTGENILPEFQDELRARNKENNWSVEGMNVIELK